MSVERHRRAKEIFLAALELERERRAQAVREACGDDEELHAEVVSLLDHAETDTREFSGILEDAASVGRAALEERFAAGDVVAQRYTIQRRLGRGGMGEVFLARDETLGELVALKFLPGHLAGIPGFLDRLLSETRLARGISHPNVCRVYDVGESGGEPFLSMQFIEGEDLGSWLAARGPVEGLLARRMARELCAGLAAAHEQGVLHRDLKPANIQVDPDGHLHIVDFGLAAPRDGGGQMVTAGSPAYMAPELLADGPATVQSDLFGLGLVLFELLVGRRAYASASAIVAAAREKSEPPIPLRAPTAGDPVLERAVQLCLQSEPSDRPPSAAVIERALAEDDPLAGVLALGLLPTPEVVAASGARGLLSRRAAAAWLCGFAALVALYFFGVVEHLPVQRAGLHSSPQQLARSAAAHLDPLGDESEGSAHEAFGFAEAGALLPPLFGPGGEPWILAGAGEERGRLRFWYRRSLYPLRPESVWGLFFGSGRTQLEDPPLEVGASQAVVCEPNGRLSFLRSNHEVSPPFPVGEPDWRALFTAAGLKPAEFEPSDVHLPLASTSERRRSWESRGGTRRRVEAGTSAGRVALFAVLESSWPDDLPAALPESAVDGGPDEPGAGGWGGMHPWDLSYRIYDTMLAVLLVFAIPMVWRNLRGGRGDPWGGARLGLFTLVCSFSSWLLLADHAGDLTGEMSFVIVGFAASLWEAAVAWSYYLVIEPLVRRFWPKALVSWSRVLGGRGRDPLVASHVLIGSCFGVLMALLVALDSALPGWTGREQAGGVAFLPLEALDGPFSWLGTLFSLPTSALYVSLLLLMLLALLRAALGHTLPALVLAVAILGTSDVLISADPETAWLTIGVGHVGVGAVLLLRYGVLAYCAAELVHFCLTAFPLTPDLGKWYAPAGVFGLFVVLAGVLWGAFPALSRAASEISESPVRARTGPG
ncbi:MAG: serine/threonine-protein kinase [Planctomycetota bacterium]|jgi:serine/threonine-protein kinase|nr:serine/threonine-protein kinase [Planctomycetota bacterium]MDP6761278.1 serine/threonine-protein kinase [Planctomycetota bacterium]MDP6987900.1 serine/threonine-protein kinase [Planctomycetota bacterium]